MLNNIYYILLSYGIKNVGFESHIFNTINNSNNYISSRITPDSQTEMFIKVSTNH